MALPHPTVLQRISSHRDLLRVVAILGAVVVAMAVLTAILGVSGTGPGYELVPDPAGAMPF